MARGRRSPAANAVVGPDPLGTDLEQCVEQVSACAAPAHTCTNDWGRELSEIEEPDRLLLLAALTARYSAGYLRWMRSGAGETLAFSSVRVLEILESQGPTIMRDIAGSLGMTPRNMTAIVDSLEEDGLVRRTPHPNDRRATVVELTGAGRQKAERARRNAAAWVANAFNSLSLEEQQQYADMLGRIAAFFC